MQGVAEQITTSTSSHSKRNKEMATRSVPHDKSVSKRLKIPRTSKTNDPALPKVDVRPRMHKMHKMFMPSPWLFASICNAAEAAVRPGHAYGPPGLA